MTLCVYEPTVMSIRNFTIYCVCEPAVMSTLSQTNCDDVRYIQDMTAQYRTSSTHTEKLTPSPFTSIRNFCAHYWKTQCVCFMFWQKLRLKHMSATRTDDIPLRWIILRFQSARFQRTVISHESFLWDLAALNLNKWFNIWQASGNLEHGTWTLIWILKTTFKTYVSNTYWYPLTLDHIKVPGGQVSKISNITWIMSFRPSCTKSQQMVQYMTNQWEPWHLRRDIWDEELQNSCNSYWPLIISHMTLICARHDIWDDEPQNSCNSHCRTHNQSYDVDMCKTWDLRWGVPEQL